jgi:tRNA(Arg) A34 adenosine deaminase TadA
MPLPDAHWMGLAIAAAREHPAAPFGAVVVDRAGQEVLAQGVNQSWKDPTLHGEIVALNALFAREDRPDPRTLSLYTTAEPCPMCAAACVWARIGRVVYGVSIPWLGERGWRQIKIRAAAVWAAAPEPPVVVGDVCQQACAALFRQIR